jgi:hypothetical protein
VQRYSSLNQTLDLHAAPRKSSHRPISSCGGELWHSACFLHLLIAFYQVLVGDQSVNLGELQVEVPTEQSPFSLVLIIGIAVSAGILIVIILIVVIAYRRKSQESDRELKRMQNQMDILESKVAKECKEGMRLIHSLLNSEEFCVFVLICSFC